MVANGEVSLFDGRVTFRGAVSCTIFTPSCHRVCFLVRGSPPHPDSLKLGSHSQRQRGPRPAGLVYAEPSPRRDRVLALSSWTPCSQLEVTLPLLSPCSAVRASRCSRLFPCARVPCTCVPRVFPCMSPAHVFPTHVFPMCVLACVFPMCSCTCVPCVFPAHVSPYTCSHTHVPRVFPCMFPAHVFPMCVSHTCVPARVVPTHVFPTHVFPTRVFSTSSRASRCVRLLFP